MRHLKLVFKDFDRLFDISLMVKSKVGGLSAVGADVRPCTVSYPAAWAESEQYESST